MNIHAASADGVSLEGGFTFSANFPTGTNVDPPFGGVGFLGQFNYEIPHWGFGIRGRGNLTNPTALHVEAGGYVLDGNLVRRYYSIDALARYFFQGESERKRWYLELCFFASQTDFVDSDQVYIAPQSPDYTRIFLRGSGFSLGIGYRPVKGPWFFQLNYELTRYETLLITGEVNYLHPILEEPALNSNYFINTVYFAVGLDVFGR